MCAENETTRCSPILTVYKPGSNVKSETAVQSTILAATANGHHLLLHLGHQASGCNRCLSKVPNDEVKRVLYYHRAVLLVRFNRKFYSRSFRWRTYFLAVDQINLLTGYLHKAASRKVTSGSSRTRLRSTPVKPDQLDQFSDHNSLC
jgi:hypothetical protein